MLKVFFLIGLLLLFAGVIAWLLRWIWLWSQSEQRLQQARSSLDAEAEVQAIPQRSWLGWWLFRAGFRRVNAVALFLLATLMCTAIALLLGLAIYQSQIVTVMASLLRALPGNVGEVFLPLAWASPVLGLVTCALAPAVVVRGRRRQRVTQIEQDLPLTLDLLATLAEAGLSFDAALDRVLETQRRERPLAEDFRLFRLEILTGRGRIDALQRLGQIVYVPWFSIFISALIHAEQVGAGLATTLRAQADDLRSRRRERALAIAMAVPVKLLFPLIVCFLPGIMIASLGPIIFQVVQVLDQFIRSSLGG